MIYVHTYILGEDASGLNPSDELRILFDLNHSNRSWSIFENYFHVAFARFLNHLYRLQIYFTVAINGFFNGSYRCAFK